MKKRLCCLLLALTMALALLPTGALAAGDETSVFTAEAAPSFSTENSNPLIRDRLKPVSYWNEHPTWNLPNPFEFLDGTVVGGDTQAERDADWAKRADEIREMLQYYMYGYKPAAPDVMGYTMNGNNMTLNFEVDGRTATWNVNVLLPNAENFPVPPGGYPAVITVGSTSVNYTNAGYASISLSESALNNSTTGAGIIKELYFPDSIYGTHGYPGNYLWAWLDNRDVPSSLMCTAWGASRIIDALEMGAHNGVINPTKLAITGMSRSGKSALVAGAFDERIAVVCPGNAGSGGPSIERFVTAYKGLSPNYYIYKATAGGALGENDLVVPPSLMGTEGVREWNFSGRWQSLAHTREQNDLWLSSRFQFFKQDTTYIIDTEDVWKFYFPNDYGPGGASSPANGTDKTVLNWLTGTADFQAQGPWDTIELEPGIIGGGEFYGSAGWPMGFMTSMPFDGHFLLSLCAPRGLFITGGFTDDWSGAEPMAFGYYVSRQTYKFLGITDKIGFYAKDAGHAFGIDKQQALMKFTNYITSPVGEAYADKQTYTAYPYPSGIENDELGTGYDARRAADYERMNWNAEQRSVPANISLADTTAVQLGVPMTLDYAVTPDNATGLHNIKWSSSDPTVATVDADGVVTGVASGTAVVAMTVGEVTASTTVQVFAPVYSSDFEDDSTWGFVSHNNSMSPVSVVDKDGSKALKFVANNAGSDGGLHNATKTFSPAIIGDQVKVSFDWYPGTMDYTYREGVLHSGLVRLIDDNRNPLISIRVDEKTGVPLGYYLGSGGGSIGTAVDWVALPDTFMEKNAWYSITVLVDFAANTIDLTVTDRANPENTVTLAGLSLEGYPHNARIDKLVLQDTRPGGDRLKWNETYLDNISISAVSPYPLAYFMPDDYSFKTVYVGSAPTIADIGLPSSILTRTPFDGESYAQVDPASWTSEPAWDTSKEGMYLFTASLVPDVVNPWNKQTHVWVYNRLTPEHRDSIVRPVENLDRGVVALKATNGIFVSWRLLATEYATDIAFNLYKNDVKLNAAPITTVTNYLDAGGVPGDVYVVETIQGENTTRSRPATAQSENYLSFGLQRPPAGLRGGTYSYPDDLSMADLDGDGRYEIIVKWHPSTWIDSGVNGSLTNQTIFDAYTLEGRLLWRIDIGLNATSGDHYNAMVVYDFDGDGRAEVALKTADGTTAYGVKKSDTAPGGYAIDYTNKLSVIGDESKNTPATSYALNTASERNNSRNRVGHISVDAPEFFTMFDGITGAAIDTVPWLFPTEDPGLWGDLDYNRSDRYLATGAYVTDSDGDPCYAAVMCRGYYERTTLSAFTLKDGKIKLAWAFDSEAAGEENVYVQCRGAHSTSVADVDNDGYDEIIYGAVIFDDDGTVFNTCDGLYGRPNLSHGDALHAGAFIPGVDGIQIMMPHEEWEDRTCNTSLRDAGTGELLVGYSPSTGDVGRGLAANLTPLPGFEIWSSGNNVYNPQGEIVTNNLNPGNNFAIRWDGDLLHELLNGGTVTKTTYNAETKRLSNATILTMSGVTSHGKSVPGIQADVLGDWREEIVIPVSYNTMRIYSTTTPTDYMIYSFMHDGAYRMQTTGQNAAYNQPPHLSFYLGEDVAGDVLAMGLHKPNVAPIVYQVDTAALEALIAEAAPLTTGSFTAETFAALTAAYNAAVALLPDAQEVGQLAVNDAAAALRAAIDGLIKKATIMKIDGGGLRSVKKGKTLTLKTIYDGELPLSWVNLTPTNISIKVNDDFSVTITGLKAGTAMLAVKTTDGSNFTTTITISVTN